MFHTDNQIFSPDKFRESFGNGDRSMLSSGTPNPDIKVGLAIVDVSRNQVIQHVHVSAEKFPGFFETHDVMRHIGIHTGLVPEILNKIRVWKKTHIDNQIAVTGDAVFEAEGYEINPHFCKIFGRDALGKTLQNSPQFVNIEICSVDNKVGSLLEGQKSFPLTLDSVLETFIYERIETRMWTPCFAVSENYLFRGAVQKNQKRRDALRAYSLNRRKQVTELFIRINIQNQRSSRETAGAAAGVA